MQITKSEFNRKIARIDFFFSECKKCIKKRLQKERECSLLFGFHSPNCDLMDEYCEIQNRDSNEEWLKDFLKSFFKDHIKRD